MEHDRGGTQEVGEHGCMGGDNFVHDLLLLWAVIDLCDLTFSRTWITLHGHPGSCLVQVLVSASLVGLL